MHVASGVVWLAGYGERSEGATRGGVDVELGTSVGTGAASEVEEVVSGESRLVL